MQKELSNQHTSSMSLVGWKCLKYQKLSTKAPTLLPPQIIKPKIMMLKFILVYIWHEKIALKIQAQFLTSAYCHSCKTIQTSFLSSLQNTQLFYWVTLNVIKQNAIFLKNWLWPWLVKLHFIQAHRIHSNWLQLSINKLQMHNPSFSHYVLEITILKAGNSVKRMITPFWFQPRSLS